MKSLETLHVYAQAKFQVISFNNLKDIYDFPIC